MSARAWLRRAGRAVPLLAVLAAAVARAAVVGDGTAGSCTEAALDAALDAGGSVTFACGGPATIVVTARKVLSGELTIDGGGTVTLSGAGAVPVLLVAPGASVRLEDLTIADGAADQQPGAAIRNLGVLEMSGVTLTESFTRGFGGGLSNEGIATVDTCTIVANQGGSGGGIANFRILHVRRSTIFRNTSGIDYGYGSEQAGSGGGILNLGTLDAVNTTITANVAISNNGDPAPAYGAGLYNAGDAVLTGCSLTRNRTPGNGYCAAIENAGLMTARNTLVGDSGACCSEGTITAESVGNLIDDRYSYCPSFTAVPAGGLALLGLGPRGGPTMTVGLRADSAAIDAGDPSVCSEALGGRDQRGVERFAAGDAGCDVGAFEAHGAGDPPPTPVPGGTFFAFRGERGDYISGGGSLRLTPADARFDAGGEPGFAGVEIWTPEPAAWEVWLQAPAMSALAVGDYEGAERWPFQAADRPGLDVSGDGRGCNMNFGRFSIRENVTAIDGTLERFAADFEQHCEEATAPALYGSLRINSAAPTASPPRGSPTRTATATGRPATPTPPPRVACVGDCDEDGAVTIDEIIVAIRAALGQVPVDACAAADGDLDGVLTINDLITIVNAALINCG